MTPIKQATVGGTGLGSVILASKQTPKGSKFRVLAYFADGFKFVDQSFRIESKANALFNSLAHTPVNSIAD